MQIAGYRKDVFCSHWT